MHDICISAPTGSGKTLAYALPIVQGLVGCGHPHPMPTFVHKNVSDVTWYHSLLLQAVMASQTYVN